MTGKAADTIGLTDRGYLKDGYAADILVIDFNNIKDNGDYTNPKQLATGIDYAIVNGNILIEDGKATPKKAGKVLRFKGR